MKKKKNTDKNITKKTKTVQFKHVIHFGGNTFLANTDYQLGKKDIDLLKIYIK